MNDLKHMQDRNVLMRFVGGAAIYPAVVKNVENNGLWLEMPSMMTELKARDADWKTLVASINKPIVFVPFSAVTFLIAVAE